MPYVYTDNVGARAHGGPAAVAGSGVVAAKLGGAAAAPAFPPASLAAKLLGRYTPWDAATVWLDTAGTTPAVADNALVARCDDVSGHGHHLIAAGGLVGLRLAVAAVNGRNVLRGQQSVALSGLQAQFARAQPIQFLIAARLRTASVDGQTLVDGCSSATDGNAARVAASAGNTWKLYAGSNGNAVFVGATTAWGKGGFYFNGTSSEARWDGGRMTLDGEPQANPGGADPDGVRLCNYGSGFPLPIDADVLELLVVGGKADAGEEAAFDAHVLTIGGY